MDRVEVQTIIGKLSCEVHTDSAYPGLTIYWNGRQIAVIERSGDSPLMRVLTWSDDRQDPCNVIGIFPGYGE